MSEHSFGINLICLLILLSSVNGYYKSYRKAKQISCQIKSYGIETIEQLQEAVNNAKPGDTIKLDPITYSGDLIININNKYITIDGDNQCNKNTIIKGEITITSNNIIIRDIVFLNSPKAISVDNSHVIQFINLVFKFIENAIEILNSKNIVLNNIVMEKISGNAIAINSVSDLTVNSLVLEGVNGIGILIEGQNNNIDISNTVAHEVECEVIKISGNSNNGRISNTVITGDSSNGEAWIKADVTSFKIIGTVGNGDPKHAIMINGCKNYFANNICNMMDSKGYCIYVPNKRQNCYNKIEQWTNMNMGGRVTN